MTWTIATDILFRDDPGPDRLKDVAARAFRIASENVAVAEAAGHDQISNMAQVVLLHRSQTMPGDFPAWYGLTVDAGLIDDVDRALNTMSHGLGTVALSDAEDEQDMTLHLPDGSGHVVCLEQGDDDAFRITPEMRQLIESVGRRAPGTGNSPTDPSQAINRRKVIAS